MTSAQGLHLKTIALIVIMLAVAPLGDTFLGKGMKRIPPMASWAPSDLFRFFFHAFTSGTIWIRHRIAAHVFRRLSAGAFLGGL